MEPIRNFLRHKHTSVKYYEAEATKIDYEKRVVYISDDSDIKGTVSSNEVPFDMLVVGVGAENATFGIPGVRENSCFLKEVGDAQKIRKRIMDCCETATFKDQSPEERKRLLHMVVVGGGPTVSLEAHSARLCETSLCRVSSRTCWQSYARSRVIKH